MKRRTFSTCALTVAVILTGCEPDRAAAPATIAAPSFAKGGNIDTDSRAVLVWEDDVTVSEGVTVPAGIHGDDYDRLSTLDGADEYQGQVCGVHAKIFNTSALSGSGDLVFDPDFDAPGKSCNGVSRKLLFHLSHDGTTAGPPTAIGTFTNVRRIWFDPVLGVPRLQAMRFIFVNQSGCETLEFNSAVGGDDIMVTRLADTQDALLQTVRNWRVESAGGHRAMCMVSSKGKSVPNGTPKYLPFSFTVTEVPYPYQIFP